MRLDPSCIDGGTPALRLFLIWSTWELAVYTAVKKCSKGAKEAWEMCHEALKVRLKTVPRFVRYLLKFYLFFNFAKKRTWKTAKKS